MTLGVLEVRVGTRLWFEEQRANMSSEEGQKRLLAILMAAAFIAD